jgi:hypothetical protein
MTTTKSFRHFQYEFLEIWPIKNAYRYLKMAPVQRKASSGLLQIPLRFYSKYQNDKKMARPTRVGGALCFDACFGQLEPKPASGGQTK